MKPKTVPKSKMKKEILLIGYIPAILWEKHQKKYISMFMGKWAEKKVRNNLQKSQRVKAIKRSALTFLSMEKEPVKHIDAMCGMVCAI